MDNQNNSVNENVTTEPTVVPTVEPTVNPTVVPTTEPTVAPTTEPTVQPTVAPQVEPTVVPTVQPSVAPQAPSAQSNSKKGIIIAIVAVLLIAAAVGVYFVFFKKASGKQVVDGTINKIFASAVKASEKLEKNVVIDYKKDIVQTNGTVKATIDTNDESIKQALNNLSSLSVDYDLRLDLKTLSGSLDLTEKENDNEVITLNTLLKDKMLYFKTNKTTGVYKYDLSDQIDWDSIDISKLPEYKSNSLSALIKKLQGYLKDAIKEEYIETEDGEFTVEGQSVKGMKTSIKLTEERVKEIQKSIYNSLLNDEDGLKMLSEFLMEDKDQVKTQVEQARDSLDRQNNTSYSTTLDTTKKVEERFINIYTTKQGKFLAFDAISGEESEKNGVTAVSNNGTTTIKGYTNGKVSIKLDYNEKDKELVWKNDAEGNKNETVKIKFEEDGLKITFSMDGVTLTLDFYEKVNNDTVSMNLSAAVNYNMEGQKIDGKVSLENNLRKVDNINTFDTSSSKKVDSLTEAEQEQLGNELKNALEKSTVFSLLEQMSKSSLKSNTKASTYSTYTSPYCAQAYDCQNYGGDYNYCKYKDGGYEYTTICPAN